MPKVILKGFILVPEEELETVKSALPIHMRLTKSEAGCLVFQVVENLTTRCALMCTKSLQIEIRLSTINLSQRFRLGRVTVNVERHYEILDVQE